MGSDGCEKTGCSDPGRVKQQLIYRLGLVFYELFSGGEKPPPELLVNPSFLVETHKDDDQKISTSFRDLDFARSLQVNDDSKADEESDSSSDPSIQNDLLGFAERSIAEDLNEKCNRLRSRKRQSTFRSSLRYSEHSEGNRDKKAALCRVITQVSIEKLKLKGLPGSLSNLIYNMIDCINGDFKGDHSYRTLSDVTPDLRLMVEYPDKFLRDLDVNSLSLTPLSLKDSVFERKDEFASLQCAYRRSASGSPEIALIAGESGTGKSWLANRIGRFILSNSGIFLQGKFDRLHRTQPFSVLATAFNAYCDVVIRETNGDRAKLIASKLQDALGPDACQLAKVIPTLRQVIECEEPNNNSDANQNYIDAEKRLSYLFSRFVETISRYSGCVIALFLDDLQWADDVSLSIVGEILKSSDASERFFFLGSYRDDEIDNGHPVLKMIENAQSLGVTASTVKLRCMDKDMVTRMLSHLLCLSPDFVAHRRWEWNEEDIMSRSLPDDVAVLFSQRIDKLPSDVKLALNTLSCFENHWRDHYDLSLELYELAAECALITGDMISLSVITDQVTKNARCFEDTLNISYTCMSTLGYASQISDSVEMGLEIMSKLAVLQVNPNLVPLIPLKMVEITIEHGMSHLSPIGFAFFGSLVAQLGDLNGGHKFTCIAKSLIDKMMLRDIAGEVLCVSTDILCFIVHFRMAIETRKENEVVALTAGNVTWACYSRLMYVTGTFWSGSKLSVSLEVIDHGRRFVMSRGHLTSDNYLLLLQQSILKLIGNSQSEIIPDDELKQRVLDSNNHHALEIYYFQKTYASFMLDNYESMKESAIELFKFSTKPWLLMSNRIFHVLVGGLVSFRIYRETKLSCWLERGTKFKSQMQLWAEQGSSSTFENKYFLLEAEEQFSKNKLDVVRATYDKTISSARAHKLVHEEAIACELAANFYFNIDDFSTSLKYYTSANEKYSEWGAYAIARRLFRCVGEKFTSYASAPSSHPISSTDGFERQRFDSEADQRKRKQP
eukprot:CCRYP_009905-RA/>CCRYP_009905-RA protein AED:0.10 eAED:0.10 QI:612/0.62/0.44/1/1/1/9/202/1008